MSGRMHVKYMEEIPAAKVGRPALNQWDTIKSNLSKRGGWAQVGFNLSQKDAIRRSSQARANGLKASMRTDKGKVNVFVSLKESANGNH